MLSHLADNDVSEPHVLVVDDDTTVRSVVVDYLRAAGMSVSEAGDGVQALSLATQGDIDVIVLDLMIPRIDGLEVVRRLHTQGLYIPVIMLTAKTSETERILGLETGADDYVTKPFSPRELVLRVQAVLRRRIPANTTTSLHGAARLPDREEIHDGELHLDITAHKAFLHGEELNLTMREFDLLVYLVSNPDQVLSRDQLMAAVWGWDAGDSSTVTVHVRRLRAKIENDINNPKRLITVWGRGYRWESSL